MNLDEFGKQSDKFSESATDAGKKAGSAAVRKSTKVVGKAAGKAGKAAIKAAGKAIAAAAKALIKALMALLEVLGPIALIIIAILIFLALVWDWDREERGSAGSYDMRPAEENVVVADSNGKFTAAALTKNQAYIDAYYKYMACSSYSKTVGGDEVFTFRENTSDFAGLQDYYEKENFFYLSPNFIKMADERLNKNQFFYPEQIVKPISYELTDEGVVKQVPIRNEDGAVQAKSKQWTWPGYATQTDTEVTGVWDYGFGSMLKYDPLTKQKFIDCEYTHYQIDVDKLIPTTTGERREHWYVIDVEIPPGSDENSVMAGYYAAIESAESQATIFFDVDAQGPDPLILREMIREQHHINMWLDGRDIVIGKRTFTDPALSAFANNTEKYPIQIPLLNSVATFSGNIAYTYTDFLELTDIHDVGDTLKKEVQKAAGVIEYGREDPPASPKDENEDEYENEINTDGTLKTDSFNYTDTAEPINSVWVDKGVSSCGTTKFWVDRKGDVKTITPALSHEEDDPVGDEYLRDYANTYVTYVPKSVIDDYDFSKRIEKDETNRQLLKDLGLLVPFSGIYSTGADYNVFAISGLSESDFNVLLEGTAFEGTASTWVKLEQEYGVNAIFGIAVAYQESGFGTSNLAQTKNNAFGLLGKNGWMRFSSLSESVYSFGRTISKNKYYINKSIDEISTHYCTSDPAGWAKAIKSLMSSRYSDLLAAGVDVGPIAVRPSQESIGNPEMLDPEAVDRRIQRRGLKQEDLFKNVNFDVVSSTNMLQTLAGEDESSQSSGVFNWLGKVWNSLVEMVSGFFDTMGSIFSDNQVYEGDRTKYGKPIAAKDIDDIVFQTITFSTGNLYSTVFDAIDMENLGFLFVGKEAMFGFGTLFNNQVMVPGVGTLLDGFISPTETHYQPLTGWSAATGGVELSTPEGTNVLSVADNGVVQSVTGGGAGSGYTVKISYTVDGKTYGVEYRYLKAVSVSVGSSVNSGDLIGTSGTKPDGTPCLFFGFTNSDGRNVDPMGYFYQPTFSNAQILEIARSQLGVKVGLEYKSWYGLNPEDPWCACFVSWCADQCGYINTGVFPKFASCTDGIESYFKPNNIYWPVKERGAYVPSPGNLIFFDWSPGDGKPDHIGFVERYENGIVYTIEGNYSNSVKQRAISIYSDEILGFAFPDYVTKVLHK